jgi:hypothetical protein
MARTELRQAKTPAKTTTPSGTKVARQRTQAS